MKKFREKINIFIAQSPQKAVLVGIMLFNIVFIVIAAAVIAVLSKHLNGLAEGGFWISVYRTITMMLDAGCIESVISDVGKAGVIAAVVCLSVVIVGMMFFSGAVIGYITNSISDFIESKNNGKNKLLISDHVVIINWNSRADEIVNEFLYEKNEVKVVVFVPDDREKVDEEIRNRLDTTLIKEAQAVYEAAEGMSFFERKKYLRKNLLTDKITYIVREGDVAAAKDLDDICISKARTVIILDSNSDSNRSSDESGRGNTQTVKTLIQVSEISKGNSDQVIMVEVADDWTEDLVQRIVEFKGEEGKEKIIPISYNSLLGKTYSHIAVMPELNDVYDTLLSNRGAHFISQNVSAEYSKGNENTYIEKRLAENCRCVPLTVMNTMQGNKAFFMACSHSDLSGSGGCFSPNMKVKLKNDYAFKNRSIVVLGHNSNMDSLMEGFDSFIRERQKLGCTDNALKVIMVDDRESLEAHDFYRGYPFVETLAADVYDEELISSRVLATSENEPEEKNILILSDDTVDNEDIDASVLTFLIYIQGQIRRKEAEDSEFRRDSLRVIVEIINPKNEDIVKSYGADKVIISSRYLSHVISQISLGETYELYTDILSYDLNEGKYSGKEIFIMPAADFFEELPGKCTAMELIRAVFVSGAEDNKTLILGYIRGGKECVFFGGDQRSIELELRAEDKLILFADQ